MPIYIYQPRGSENHVEVTMTIAEMEALPTMKSKHGTLYDVPGVGWCLRDIAAEHHGFRHKAGNWPMRSDAAGVHPDQIAEHQQALKRYHGVTTEFDKKTGEAIFRDNAHRNAHLRATRRFDKDAGYGQYAG